jgi:hypothetical protein
MWEAFLAPIMATRSGIAASSGVAARSRKVERMKPA